MRAQDQEPVNASRSQPRRTPTQSAGPGPLPLSLRPEVPLTRQAILHLQRTVGNVAVARFMEAQRQPHSRADSSEHSQPMRRSAVPDVLRSPGRPLDDDTRNEMEARLGADFSDVRLHTDAAAQASAAEVGARAYTSGSHVVIGDGGIDRRTLAHELTHVIQQRQGPVAGTDNGSGLKVSDPSDHFEREAEVNARRALSGRAPTRHDHGPAGGADNAGHSDVPVQRADIEVASQSSDMDIDQPEQTASQRSDMDVDQPAQADRSSDMDIDQPAQTAIQSSNQPASVDSAHKAEVFAALKSREKWTALPIIKGRVVELDESTLARAGHKIASMFGGDRKGKGRAQDDQQQPVGQKDQAAKRTSSRTKKVNQIKPDEVRAMYQARQGSSVSCHYAPVPGEESIVWAEVEAFVDYELHRLVVREAAGDLFQTGKYSKDKPKKQAALHTETIAGRRGVDLPSLEIPGKDHIRPIALDSPGSATPDRVTTPKGTELDKVGVYTFDSDGGSQSRMNFYAHKPEKRMDKLSVIDQSTLPPTTQSGSALTKMLGGFKKNQGSGPTQLGKGLTRFLDATKVADQISLDKARLAKWVGKRTGNQNTAMYNTSAKAAAEASGYDKKSGWQWLHLIAFTMGGRDNVQPNEEGNLVAGLAAANGFHLVLENFVKKMVLDEAVSDVTVKATANMIVGSFHVCKSIDYRISWKKNGETKAGTFIVDTLDPNKMMGSHTEMLCKQYDIEY